MHFVRRFFLKALSLSIYLFCRLYFFTLRVKEVSPLESGHPIIASIWHRDLFYAISSHHKVKFTTMASRSKDGDLISFTLERLHFKVARGSSGLGKNGVNALMQMYEFMMNEHLNGALTVDGPRGPVKKVKRGVIELSSKTQIPISPAGFLSKRYFEFKSWDKFRLPLPFSKVYAYWDTPIQVPREISPEEGLNWAKRIEDALNGIELKLHQHLKKTLKD